MLRRFLDNCKKPEGSLGRLILRGMNGGHGPVTRWGLSLMRWADGDRILDVGCGGGATVSRLLRQYPHSQVDGVDYSAQSVAVSRRTNARALGRRCSIVQGDAMALPFADGMYDGVTAVETVYFWPSLTGGLEEVRRVLRPGGRVLLICEMSDPVRGRFWSSRCPGMTIYTGAQLRDALHQAGFEGVCLYERGAWAALIARKKE